MSINYRECIIHCDYFYFDWLFKHFFIYFYLLFPLFLSNYGKTNEMVIVLLVFVCSILALYGIDFNQWGVNRFLIYKNNKSSSPVVVFILFSCLHPVTLRYCQNRIIKSNVVISNIINDFQIFPLFINK